MYKAIGVILILLLLIPSTRVAAEEDAYVLLNKYNISGYDLAEEEKKLKVLEDEYSDVAYRVNTHTMLEAAMELQGEQKKAALVRIDSKIYKLTDELRELEALMEQSNAREVSYIMELDTRYRNAMEAIDRKQEERRAWTEQKKEVNVLSQSDANEDRSKLQSLNTKLEKQKKQYEQATACLALGDVTQFQSPLEIPVQLTSPYGERLDPITLDAISFHRGIDLYAPIGTGVLAAFNGEVEEATSSEELGNYVVINHGCGIKTMYGHLDSYEVEPGEQVQQYQRIASSGNTGTRTTGPHLHFAVYINGKTVDPLVFVPY